MYDKLVTKVNNIDTTGFVLKTKYETDRSDLEKKTPDTSPSNIRLDEDVWRRLEDVFCLCL